MADPHVDRDVEKAGIQWFAGREPLPPIGPCPHDCRHTSLRVVAWGYDLDHYTLDECHDEEGCAGQCRGWMAEVDLESRPNGPHRFLHGMQQVRTGVA